MTPWPAMLRLAVSVGLTPAAFWRLSLREWRWLTQCESRTGLGVVELAALMARFPDEGN